MFPPMSGRLYMDAEIRQNASLSPRGFKVILGVVAAASTVFSIFFFVIGAWPAPIFLGLDVLLAPDPTHAYAFSPLSAPRHWLAYWLFPLRPSALEVAGFWNASLTHLVVTGLAWLALVAAVARRSPRLALALVLGGSLALAPALPLGMAANQYAYGFSAWCVACLALAWPTLGRPGRGLLLFVALVSSWHGINVQRGMRDAGQRQAQFQPALMDALDARPEGLRLRAPERHGWLFRRLGHAGVSDRQGELIGDRLQWVDAGQPADYQVTEDGQLRRLP